MTIQLQQGGNINLSQTTPALRQMTIGLGWASDANVTLHGALLALNQHARLRSNADYHHHAPPRPADGAGMAAGRERNADDHHDQESITIDLNMVPADVAKVSIAVVIREGAAHGQNFAMVRQAYIRCIDANNTQEIVRFDLPPSGGGESAMIFGEIYRARGDWKFKAVGQGFAGGIDALLRSVGFQHG